MKRKLFAYLFVLFAGAMTLACAQQNVATQVKVVNVQTDTVEVMSQKMNRGIKAVVVLPNQHFDNPTDSFPTVYVLHGAWGIKPVMARILGVRQLSRLAHKEKYGSPCH